MHPRLARMMIEAEKLGVIEFASELCAILSEKDFYRRATHPTPGKSDLLLRWELLDQDRKGRQFRSHLRLSQQIARSFANKNYQHNFSHQEILPKLLLGSFLDLLCRRRSAKSNKAVKIDGSGVRIGDSSVVIEEEFFVALQLMEGVVDSEALVTMASAIPKELLLEHHAKLLREESSVRFDEKTQRLVKFTQTKLKELPMEEPRAIPISEDEAQQHLPEILLARWNELLAQNENLKNWVTRYAWFEQKTQGQQLSEKIKLSALQEACYGEKRFADVCKKDLIYFFENQFPPPTIKQFHEQCPAFIEVPTGNKINLQYFPDKDPVLEVRLQEIFGWREAPRLIDGKVSVTLHLLGPNYRPVQVTQDLGNFWKSGYNEVRKELRSRYPKHSWPDDPLTAQAVAKGRSRK